ncbi:isoquinoline 1-oxidoreductase, alpha subunit [Azoarcus sp. CIB]|uniref:(2Fe-2S)-binding protein n=1 Tax=Aromatoleum sp. (strain CIB) TaxID=198107 RepID=UPI00067D1EFB|nr:(2Fe-2S)-binding protein [Azoarcus sp. CIB]AKU13841.1 isoquinoline 1-oxidoreductase, alpha subunit [Azoarcus sp. CIB]
MTRFILNGQKVNTSMPEDTPLLWVLRDGLELTGTKFGCGMGLCGACTVHVDGVAVKSCSTPVSEVADKHVTTIEQIGRNRVGAAVQAAWQKLDVVQCGYCQSGQIMAATALLTNTPRPSDADIDAAMAANLCRCATYVRIRAAIHEAAKRLAGRGAA